MENADLSRVGAQSYSFRNFDFAGSIRCLQSLGLSLMEYCGVHFPPDASAPEFGEVKQSIEAAGLRTLCFGVERFSSDTAANRQRFEFAKALGVEVLTADPAPESFDDLDRLCEEFQIKIAIHNHGPGARYDTAEDTLKAVTGHHPFVGACVDTGHAIRSGEAPHEVIAALGARVHSVHLKDWRLGGEEQILGEGDLDLGKVAEALRSISFGGPIMMEYELSPEDPVSGMQQGLANWRHAAG